MTTKDFSRGSEWRKWDLHVHTPLSIIQKYGGNKQEVWEKYISDLEALSEEFAVLGINDYLFLDGYERLVKEQQNKGRLKNLVLLPVVEFRIDKLVGVDFGKYQRINLHVIFSNELSIDTIKSQFLNTLDQHYVIEKLGEKWERAINKQSLEDLGKRIKDIVKDDDSLNNLSDLAVGFNNLNINEEKIIDSLKSKDCFKDKFLIAVGKTEWDKLKWSSGSIATKKNIINIADLVFTSSDSIDNFYKAKKSLKENKVNDLLLDCSDAHNFSSSSEKERIGNCNTWIKADPTFDGLRQVINEPERVFIGHTPDIHKRVRENRTKYIDSLQINPVITYNNEFGKWFQNVNIPINPELVAIIGNKGSGKSAIADIIALCGNHIEQEDFSFLNEQKFRDGKHANSFEAKLTWKDAETNKKILSDDKTHQDVVRVKYLPQGYFERLINEISATKEFQKEIENVVFRYLDDEEKINYASFDEFINDKKSRAEQEINILKQDVIDINKKIIDLEKKSHKNYKLEIQNKLDLKNKELKALIEPTKVENPTKDPNVSKQQIAISNSIENLYNEINKIEHQIAILQEDKKKLIIDLRVLNKTKEDIEIKLNEFDKFKQAIGYNLAKYAIDIDKIFKVAVNFNTLDNLIKEKEAKLKEINVIIGYENDEKCYSESLVFRIKECRKQIGKEKEKLDRPQKKYQEYLTSLKEWENQRRQIVGSAQEVGSKAYYESELNFINNKLPEEIEKLRTERFEKVEEIFNEKQIIISIYKRIKKKIDEIIEKNSHLLREYQIDINAKLTLSDSFREKFFEKINRNVSGTFYSIEGSEIELNKIMNNIDFDNKDDIIRFLKKLDEALHKDMREKYSNKERYLSDQVKNATEFYNYLYTLEFLEANYQLMQNNKTLEQLSPGERGALLLIFYLLLDKNDIPLILDQPEDNLDNNSVANILVPFIRRAKLDRQIIMVTHNPNLAVVADAEQVIHVNIDKNKDNIFSYKSGSIENRDINKCIVKVHEGTMPAFNKRKHKYYE